MLAPALAALLVVACNTSNPPAAEVPSPVPSPASSPAPSPTQSTSSSQASFYYLPSPIGKPVAAAVLWPASTLPAARLCSAPIREFQDGNAGPLFCSNGAIIVQAWRYFAPIDTHLMSLGRSATGAQVKAAINADFRTHTTNPIEGSGYDLARAYYHWTFAFDYWAYVMGSN